MKIRGESEFARAPVLEHCTFFTYVQCSYCGYLILGGSARELLDEEERHAIECRAAHGSIGVRILKAQDQKHQVLRETLVLSWSTTVFISIAT